MVLAAHQPHYLPWLGYFDKMDRADVFVLLDTVQFEKNGWQNRNKIKTSQGWQWLTVPVTYEFPARIDQVRINNRVRWGKKHWQALITNYRKAPYFAAYAPFFEETYRRSWEMLVDVNLHTIQFLKDVLKIETEIKIASRMEPTREDPNGRLIDLCRQVGADTYLAGAGGRAYMDVEAFRRAGIRVVFQEYEHPVYPQLYGEFVPNLSVVDLLFNCGPESLSIIRSGRKG